MTDEEKKKLEADMKITELLLGLNKFHKEDFDLNKIKEIAYRKREDSESNEPKKPNQLN